MCQVFLAKMRSLWSENEGVLSFEWTLLLTLLTIGVVGGITVARDAIIDELGDVAQGMLALDDSFTIYLPLEITLNGVSAGGASDSGFNDARLFNDCDRNTVVGQDDMTDSPD